MPTDTDKALRANQKTLLYAVLKAIKNPKWADEYAKAIKVAMDREDIADVITALAEEE